MDRRGYEQLFRDHYQPLCLFAYGYLKDMDAAKDVVQDFFFQCWQKRDTLSPIRNFQAYAFRSVRNGALNYLSSDEVRSRNIAAAPFPYQYDPHSENAALQQDDALKAALLLAIQQLPEQRRKIFLLSNGEGYKYAEIADQLNISINTVKTQLRKAYDTLRKERERLGKLLTLLLLLKVLALEIFFSRFL